VADWVETVEDGVRDRFGFEFVVPALEEGLKIEKVKFKIRYRTRGEEFIDEGTDGGYVFTLD